ncbi:MAG TPA: hypothetical protein PLD59_15680, partial [Tepidisphaeraceae bacterium]|nr:hypothetical protein [Tepidisphaeraceae bacterium]
MSARQPTCRYCLAAVAALTMAQLGFAQIIGGGGSAPPPGQPRQNAPSTPPSTSMLSADSSPP